jgi:predicted dehydrogenase
MTSVGIIGNGVHSKRIQKILKKNYFIYKPVGNKIIDKKNFEILKKKKIIFICSPNSTHFDYVKKLYKKRYIFCEKPPVTSKKDLKKLKKFSFKKIFFNFNQRFSSIAEILKSSQNIKMGSLLYGNIINSHGLAFKKNFANSWRSNINKNKLGVYETVSIHDIDLINYFFKIKKINKPKLKNFQKVGSSFDTSYSTISLKNGGQINVFSSYSSAYTNQWILMFEHGLIQATDNEISLHYPTKTFDKSGFFTKPKKKITLKVYKNEFEKSLKSSISYFLKNVRKRSNFNKKDFDKSIESNNLLFS